MVGVYVHIPFCTKKCPYCHFFVLPNKPEYKELLLEGLSLEWEQKKELIKEPVSSIYFGGGTPSLHPQAIEKLLSLIPHNEKTEITLECNPESMIYIDGINRISIGVQSLHDDSLITLGRTHSSSKAVEAIHFASKNVDNITIDLMYDLPHQTLRSWRKTLRTIDQLPITHLSLYNLTIEPHTSFYKNKMGKHRPPEGTSLQMLNSAITHVEEVGLKRYEISAFAKPGYEAVHNTGYWKGVPFLGLGPSAFSYWEGKRFQNHCNLRKYVKDLKEEIAPVGFSETLPYPNNILELFAIRLRLVEGAPLNEFDLPKKTHKTIEKLICDGYLLVSSNVCRLSEKGLLFYDTVASELI